MFLQQKNKSTLSGPLERQQLRSCCEGKHREQKCWHTEDLGLQESVFFAMDPKAVNIDNRRHQRQQCCVVYVHLHAKNKLPRHHEKKFGNNIQEYKSYLKSHYSELWHICDDEA